MYKDRFIITDNTIWVLNFFPSINVVVLILSPCINYLSPGFNVFSMHKLFESWI